MPRIHIQLCGLYLISNFSYAATSLDNFLDGLQTFQANFIQIVIATNHHSIKTSSGTFYLSRPGLFRWDYTNPQGQQIIGDGDRVWLYDVELQQVSHQAQDDALRGTPALLLSDNSPVSKHFKIIELGERNGLTWLELIPKETETQIVKIQIAFDNSYLDRFEMIDNFGQITRFLFSKVQRNPNLTPELFRFDPPPEVDILGR
jgi:outer membrane lipoprotein carrier protein